MLGAENLGCLILAVAFVKVLHELGHALACRHFGGECRELGVMLLAFIPCLYCNVSDAWLLPNRWHRIAVSAAGICVELTLAAVCTFLWWYSESGIINSVCFSVMFVASVGTLLLNGNPLLRYDGYHVLADLLDIPNLRQRAMAACRRYLARWVFGAIEPEEHLVSAGGSLRLALYGAASTAYLWFVIVAMLTFLDRALEPYGLRPFVLLLAVIVIGGRVGASSHAAWRRIRYWSAAGLVRPFRISIGFALLVGIAAVGLLTPLPHRVAAPFIVSIRDARNVYVTMPGRFTEGARESGARYGEVQSAGDTIAVLDSHQLERDIVRLRGECDRRRTVIATLRLLQFSDPDAVSQLRTMEVELQDYQNQLAQRVSDSAALRLTAPTDGILLQPPDVTLPGADRLIREEAPLNDRNRHAYLESGTVVGVVGTPGQFDALLAVDEVDIPYVQPGQSVRLRLPQMGPTIATGTVEVTAAREMEQSLRPLVETQRLASRPGEDGILRPVRPMYEVRVSLNNVPGSTVVGATGEARIRVGTITPARWIIRLIESTFAGNH